MSASRDAPLPEAGLVHAARVQPDDRVPHAPGISVWGSRELRVRGRKSGEWRAVPVNLLDASTARATSSHRVGNTQWVRNLRVAQTGELRVGRRTEAFRGDRDRRRRQGPDPARVPEAVEGRGRRVLRRRERQVVRRRAAPHRARSSGLPHRRRVGARARTDDEARLAALRRDERDLGPAVPLHQGRGRAPRAAGDRVRAHVARGGGAARARRRARARSARRSRHWKPVLAFAAIEMAGPWLLLTNAEKRLPSGLTGLLVSCVPIFGALARVHARRSHRVAARARRRHRGRPRRRRAPRRRRPRRLGRHPVVERRARCCSCASATRPRRSSWPAGSATCRRIGVVAVARHRGRDRGRAARVVRAPGTSCRRRPTLWAMLGLAVVCTGIAFVVFFALIAEVGPARATLITFVNPAVAVVLGAVVLDESITAATIGGFVLVLTGCWLATRPGEVRGRRRPRSSRSRPRSPAVDRSVVTAELREQAGLRVGVAGDRRPSCRTCRCLRACRSAVRRSPRPRRRARGRASCPGRSPWPDPSRGSRRRGCGDRSTFCG